MDPMRSPLLDLPGAVAGAGADAPVAAHYGSFHGEQRTLEAGDGFVDLSHRGVVRIAGPDRLTWLHSLTTQAFEGLAPGVPTAALVLSPRGHVEHLLHGRDEGGDDGAFVAHVEPGTAAGLVEFLDSMRFMMRVEVADVTDELAVCWRPGKYDVLPRAELARYAEAAGPACGTWAFEALRIARGRARFGVDTDDRTIPNEVGWVPPAAVDATQPGASDTPRETGLYPVHLDKGCYRGQETVARVHNLGRPPRRLTLLHLDGSEDRLPEVGAPVRLAAAEPAEGRQVGRMGSSARHHELGPIGLALLKRNVPVDATLVVDGLPAAQEVVVDPEVGLHVRPMRDQS